VQYGYINLEEIFRDSTRLSAVDLSSLLLAKIAATSVCVGGGLVGGLFAPSLFIGALVGDVMGHFVANRCVRGWWMWRGAAYGGRCCCSAGPCSLTNIPLPLTLVMLLVPGEAELYWLAIHDSVGQNPTAGSLKRSTPSRSCADVCAALCRWGVADLTTLLVVCAAAMLGAAHPATHHFP
jgi:hypothetical protein